MEGSERERGGGREIGRREKIGGAGERERERERAEEREGVSGGRLLSQCPPVDKRPLKIDFHWHF